MGLFLCADLVFNYAETLHPCCDIGRGNWLGNGSGLQCVFSNDETTHLCYDIGRGNGETLILSGIWLKFVVCCCGICYFDVFLSSRLGVYVMAMVLYFYLCCTFIFLY